MNEKKREKINEEFEFEEIKKQLVQWIENSETCSNYEDKRLFWCNLHMQS